MSRSPLGLAEGRKEESEKVREPGYTEGTTAGGGKVKSWVAHCFVLGRAGSMTHRDVFPDA